jgi:hypothetical protein
MKTLSLLTRRTFRNLGDPVFAFTLVQQTWADQAVAAAARAAAAKTIIDCQAAVNACQTAVNNAAADAAGFALVAAQAQAQLDLISGVNSGRGA